MQVILFALIASALSAFYISQTHAADVVPNEIQMPGTQPGEHSNLESPDKCDNCHAGYNDASTIGDPQDEPATGWRGGAMGNAGRDAIFWATVAIAEQDFDGAGDLCIRCHSTGGWYGGRSTPTDGSGLAANDDDGVDCDACHSMTNPDNSEHLGIMNTPFTANCSDDPIAPAGSCQSSSEGYYGSGMLSLFPGSDKLGPYDDADARHQFMQSKFHRDVDFCGSCHDVSNPAVGDLAPNHGAQITAPPVISSGANLGGPLEEKAAFNNPPYAYGIVERTFSEYKASAFPTTRVGEFGSLPVDLQAAGGSLDVTYQAAMIAAFDAQSNGGIAGDYADGTPRFFSCQSCHMRPVESAGANKRGVQIRKDLPQHDHTGGNYWFADITKYQDAKGTLRMGGDLNAVQLEAMSLGQLRAVNHLQQAASLQVSGDTLKVVNLTGHKLISGYPEGRRMWLNIKWYDAANQLIREDGAYGKIGATVGNPSGGPDIEVESILDLDAANTKIYEAHYAITRDWAQTLMAVSATTYGPIVLNYDRITGAAGPTIADLANGLAGDHQDTFHFALNNLVSKDNRIPPYGMSYDIAQKRNALPTPVNQYGAGTPGSTYNYWDDVTLNPPAGADHAHIELLYQGTSWEYIQFLDKANNKQNAFLGQEGVNMLDAWLNAPTAMDPLNRTMVAPMVMATANWGSAGGNQHPSCNIDNPVGDITIQAGDSVNYAGTASDSDGTIASYAWIFDGGSPASSNIEDPGAITYNTAGIFTTTFSATDDAGAACVAATVLVTVTATGGNQVGVSGIEVGYYQTTGKGKNKVTVFVPASSTVFIPVGENVIIRSTVTDSNGPVSGATVSSSITGLEITSITSTPSDATGIAESNWQTDTPNRKGNGGTIPGLYTVTTTNVSGNWDSAETSVTFTLE